MVDTEQKIVEFLNERKAKGANLMEIATGIDRSKDSIFGVLKKYNQENFIVDRSVRPQRFFLKEYMKTKVEIN